MSVFHPHQNHTVSLAGNHMIGLATSAGQVRRR
jgi:hypothetical protein